MKEITADPSYVISESLDITQSNWDAPAHLAIGQLSMHKLFRTVALEPGGSAMALNYADRTLDVENLEFADPLIPERKISGEQLLNRRIYNDGLIVIHRGEVLHESYRNGMRGDDRHVIHSCTKSLCAMLMAQAIDTGLIEPGLEASHYLPEFAGREEWDDVTVQHLLDMQAGIEYSEDYTNPNAHYWHYARAAGYYPPLPGEEAIGATAWVTSYLNKRSHPPGTVFAYNSCLTIVLGMVLEKVYRQPLAEIFEQQLYRRIGAESDAYFNTDPQGFPIVEGQMNLRLRDFARWASLLLNNGKNLEQEQVLPTGFLDPVITPDPEAQSAYQGLTADGLFPTGQYKNQFWVLNPEQQQFAMLGIHGQFAWYDLKRQLMLVGVGSYPLQSEELLMRSMNTLWQAVAQEIDNFS